MKNGTISIITTSICTVCSLAFGAGWHTNAWDGSRDTIVTNLYVHVAIEVVTNELGVVSTNVIYTDMMLEPYIGYDTQIVAKLYAKDIRAHDAYWAADERALNAGWSQKPLMGDLDDYVYFYRTERANVTETKIWLLDDEALMFGLAGGFNGPFADYTLADSAGVYSNLYVNDGTFYTQLDWSRSSLSAATGCPTNYDAYTPWRQLDGRGIGKGRTVSCSWEIETSYTGEVTVAVTDSWGNSQSITGTNGQVVTSTATNTLIQSGYTHLDYGWRPMTNIFAAARWWAAPSVGLEQDMLFGIGSSTSSWNEAQAEAVSSWSTNKWFTESQGVWTMGAYTNSRWNAWAFASTGNASSAFKNSSARNTNIIDTVDWYVSLSIPSYGTFDNYGLPNGPGAYPYSGTGIYIRAATGITGFRTVTGTSTNSPISPTWGTNTFPSPWCDDPTASGNTFRGFIENHNYAVWKSQFNYR